MLGFGGATAEGVAPGVADAAQQPSPLLKTFAGECPSP
jgi:hypothetical protein